MYIKKEADLSLFFAPNLKLFEKYGNMNTLNIW